VAKFPEPKTPLTATSSPVIVPAGIRLWRIYFAGGAYPGSWNAFRFFGPTPARFDHQVPPAGPSPRGILYAAGGPYAVTTCLAEVFQQTRVIDRRARSPWLTGFELTRDVPLLDLMGTWPTQAGASTAINSGPRPRARRWSQAIYAAYPTVEGLLYASSMNGHQPAYALYERAVSSLPMFPIFNRSLADPALGGRVAAAAATINYLVV
jgi:hypothetical protein